MLDGCSAYQMRSSRVGDFFQDREIVIPGDLCKHRLHNCIVRPSLGERAHVFQVARGESFHFGERSLEVCRQTVDHLRAPVFPLLPVQDIAADLPVKQDQFPVDRQRRTKLRRSNPPFQVGEKLPVASSLSSICRRSQPATMPWGEVPKTQFDFRSTPNTRFRRFLEALSKTTRALL